MNRYAHRPEPGPSYHRTRGYWVGLALLSATLWGVASLASATVRPVNLLAPLSAIEPQGSIGFVASSVPSIEDEAGAIPSLARSRIQAAIERIRDRTEIFVITRVLGDLRQFESESQAAFRDVVRQTNHYRVVVVFIAYSADKRHGIISTNLGAGIWNVITADECQGLFGNEEAPLTIDLVVNGVESLVNLFEAYEAAHPNTAGSPYYDGFDILARRLPATLIVLFLSAGSLMLYKRGRRCPRCGSPLKSRVSVSLMRGPGGRIAKKTSKCFSCGYSKRKALLPPFLESLLNSEEGGKTAPLASPAAEGAEGSNLPPPVY